MKKHAPMDLSQRALLVTLTVSTWDGRKLDRRISQEVAQAHGATKRSAGNYNKCLIDVGAPTFVKAHRAFGALRTYFYDHTLPWMQDGARITGSGNFLEFAAGLRKLGDEASVAADALRDDFPRLYENAKAELNGMFRADEYPTAHEVRERFTYRMSVLPVPAAQDFRVDLGREVAEKIRAEIETDVHHALQEAMQDAWQRLYDEVSYMAARLARTRKDKNGDKSAPIFRDTLLSNVAKVCDVLERLNLTGDEKLEEMRLKTQTLIAGIDAQSLRDDDNLRVKVARKAAEIERAMGIFMR